MDMMYNLPPPAIISPIFIQNINTDDGDEILMISVNDARYDAIARKATLDLNQAFEKSREIMKHTGKTITLTYQGHIKTDNITNCPKVRVPYTDINRDITFTTNTVTLTISNIGQTLADEISASHCLNIDSYTVKKVVNPDFDKKPSHRLNP